MKDIRVSMQYEPGSLQNIVILSSDEEKMGQPEEESTPEPESEEELVDFYITPAAVASIKSIVGWSKVLAPSIALISVVEIGLIALIVLTGSSDTAMGKLGIFRSAASLGINIWLIVLTMKFIRKMGLALKTHDDVALSEAFAHQAVYFKWAFLGMVLSLGLTLIDVIS